MVANERHYHHTTWTSQNPGRRLHHTTRPDQHPSQALDQKDGAGQYIFGYQGRHVVVTIGSKLYKMGWGFAGDMLNKAYWAFADYLSKKWS